MNWETTCMHARCDQPATVTLRSKYDRLPWPACETHRGAMQDALYVGQPSNDAAVRVTTLSEETR